MMKVFVFLTIPAILSGALGDNGVLKKSLIDGRIIGGHDADIKDYPYMVSFYSYGFYMCGAVLIAENWALTAAHCIEDGMEPFTIRAGASSIFDGASISVVRAIEHQNYTYQTKDSDIALLELSQNVSCTNCKPIKLGTTVPTPGANGTITGWGTTNAEYENDTPDFLQVAQVPIVDHEVCKKAYANDIDLTENMICAGYLETGGMNACYGDSGGPLVVDGALFGIVSMAKGCAEPGFPEIFTFVPNFSGWIRETTGLPL